MLFLWKCSITNKTNFERLMAAAAVIATNRKLLKIN